MLYARDTFKLTRVGNIYVSWIASHGNEYIRSWIHTPVWGRYREHSSSSILTKPSAAMTLRGSILLYRKPYMRSEVVIY